jgi:hypothetical protein
LDVFSSSYLKLDTGFLENRLPSVDLNVLFTTFFHVLIVFATKFVIGVTTLLTAHSTAVHNATKGLNKVFPIL